MNIRDGIDRWPVRKVVGTEPRVETGVVEFDGDWPGVFIRGDNAAGYYARLKAADTREHAVAELLSLLAACNVHRNPKLQEPR